MRPRRASIRLRSLWSQPVRSSFSKLCSLSSSSLRRRCSSSCCLCRAARRARTSSRAFVMDCRARASFAFIASSTDLATSSASMERPTGGCGDGVGLCPSDVSPPLAATGVVASTDSGSATSSSGDSGDVSCGGFGGDGVTRTCAAGIGVATTFAAGGSWDVVAFRAAAAFTLGVALVAGGAATWEACVGFAPGVYHSNPPAGDAMPWSPRLSTWLTWEGPATNDVSQT
mmetsp:Transcript_69712/g.194027  ORF Transcript_69712/g.194027 Transcript_69712/m.194027 type:complete len:229 (-) Transcript_69712:34-720(-)